MKSLRSSKLGFTLIEVIVVVGIIGLLTSIVLFSVSQARAEVRDKKRIIDIEQYQLAFRLYSEQYGSLPVCGSGAYLRGAGIVDAGSTCTDLATMQTFFDEVFGELPTDPLDDASGPSDYVYFYDSDHSACGSGQAIIAIRQMEDTPPANDATACGGLGSDGEMNTATNPYVIFLP